MLLYTLESTDEPLERDKPSKVALYSVVKPSNDDRNFYYFCDKQMPFPLQYVSHVDVTVECFYSGYFIDCGTAITHFTSWRHFI